MSEEILTKQNNTKNIPLHKIMYPHTEKYIYTAFINTMGRKILLQLLPSGRHTYVMYICIYIHNVCH